MISLCQEIEKLNAKKMDLHRQQLELDDEVLRIEGMIRAYKHLQRLGLNDIKTPLSKNIDAPKPNINIERGSVSYDENSDEIEIIGC